MSIQILPANTKIHAELLSLWERSVRATHHFLTEEDIQFYKAKMSSAYFHQVTLFYIREHSTKGFIGINRQNIQLLFVEPLARGQGYGKALLDFAITHYDIETVDVNEQNHQAVGFYQSFGFVAGERSETDGAGKPYPVISMSLDKVHLATSTKDVKLFQE